MADRKLHDEKYELKRKRITVSLTEEEQEYFINKFGKLPNATQFKYIAMGKTIKVVTKVSNIELNSLLYEIKKIGTNINQIAHKRNANELMDQDSFNLQLAILNKVVKGIYTEMKAETFK